MNENQGAITMPLKKYSDPDLLTSSQNIFVKMTDNPYYPKPQPALVVIGGNIEDFRVLLPAAASGDRTQSKLKNQARALLLTHLKQLNEFVTFTAKGDAAKLVSSGFPMRKTPQPVIVYKPGLKVTNGPNSGELVNEATNVRKNRGFLHQITADPVTDKSVWDSYSTTARKFTFSGLQRAKIYWCRVAVVGPKKQLIFSDPVSMVVL